MIKQQYSPATRAIKDAVLNLYKNDEVLRDIAWELEKDTVVVALRAAANLLNQAYANEEYVDYADEFLRDIATELEELK